MADWQGAAAVTSSWVRLGDSPFPGSQRPVLTVPAAQSRAVLAGASAPAPSGRPDCLGLRLRRGDAEEPCDWAGLVMGRGLMAGRGGGLGIGRML